jgi:hypothetical protein
VRLRWFCPIADEIQIVSKSGLTILVIGLIGAILMSLGMKHLVEVQSERDRSPYCATVESRLGAKLLGPVKIGAEHDGEEVHLTVRARVLVGLNKERLAKSAGLEVWLGALRAGARLDAVTVVIGDEDGGEAQVFAIASPMTGGAQKSPAKKKSPAPSKSTVPLGNSAEANGGSAKKGW